MVVIKWGAVVARYSTGLSIEGTVVQSHLPPFRNSGNFSHRTCLCLSEETLKAGDPFYLVSMPGEVKDPIQGV